ncbi:GNAT family N-acetyltransferase [Pontibacter vulgaris]|uniref:GNAT family N-acetyltransferase n=1 Tax=Pontibacter vulgaris TaxID=2905679 RepID=UPI001FA74307|nr:GNAT family N-acetyltransferase [Pontibacter vulgaris]
MEKAHAADYPEIVEVWEASVRATHHFLKEEDILYFKPLILNEFLKAVDLYCERDKAGSITGFLGVADGKIEMLFIHPDRRGTGIGKMLLQFAINNLHATLVDVNEQNTQAVDFYKHMGFEIKSRSELDSMGKPFPILHMELKRGDGEV